MSDEFTKQKHWLFACQSFYHLLLPTSSVAPRHRRLDDSVYIESKTKNYTKCIRKVPLHIKYKNTKLKRISKCSLQT